MTNEELAELERLLAKATPGEWAVADDWNQGRPIETRGFTVARAAYFGGTDQADHNAALIVALRNAAPSLIATAHEVEALRAENARLREALFNAIALIGHSVPMDTTALVAGELLTAHCVWHQGRAALEQGEVK